MLLNFWHLPGRPTFLKKIMKHCLKKHVFASTDLEVDNVDACEEGCLVCLLLRFFSFGGRI